MAMKSLFHLCFEIIEKSKSICFSTIIHHKTLSSSVKLYILSNTKKSKPKDIYTWAITGCYNNISTITDLYQSKLQSWEERLENVINLQKINPSKSKSNLKKIIESPSSYDFLPKILMYHSRDSNMEEPIKFLQFMVECGLFMQPFWIIWLCCGKIPNAKHLNYEMKIDMSYKIRIMDLFMKDIETHYDLNKLGYELWKLSRYFFHKIHIDERKEFIDYCIKNYSFFDKLKSYYDKHAKNMLIIETNSDDELD